MPRRAARSQEQPVVGFWCSFSDAAGVRPQSRDPREPLSDNPDLIANSSMLHDRDAGQAARVRTIARTKLMLHSDKLNARELDTRPRVVPTFLPGDMVAVWRMMKEAAFLASEHITDGDLEYMGAVRGNFWIALPRGVIKTSPEQLRPAAREERHAWQLVEAELRTKLVQLRRVLWSPV